ncbi:hypothetical protein CE91St43_26310 [Oscillospiraceae bacterium]|nr:hypothetical protein CE91St43_26310 [Oscillospiraceae bacterium]
MDVSQNQTECFGLHLWEPGDNFSREEFNENFIAIDAAVGPLGRVAAGAYLGDGAESRYIPLPFPPRAVLVKQGSGVRVENTRTGPCGGLAVAGHPLASVPGAQPAVAIEGSGLRVCFDPTYSSGSVNTNGIVYHYAAFE